VLALSFVIDWKVIRRNLIFAELAILASVVPMATVAAFNYEFPSVAGGLVGLLTTIFLARRGIGLAKDEGNAPGSVRENSQAISQQPEASPLHPGDVLRASVPLLATVGILLQTRIPFLGLRHLLTSEADWVSIPLGPLGVFSLSPSLVFQLRGILGEDLHWSRSLVCSIHSSVFCRCRAGPHSLSLPTKRFWEGGKRNVCTSPESGNCSFRSAHFRSVTQDRWRAGVLQDSWRRTGSRGGGPLDLFSGISRRAWQFLFGFEHDFKPDVRTDSIEDCPGPGDIFNDDAGLANSRSRHGQHGCHT